MIYNYNRLYDINGASFTSSTSNVEEPLHNSI